MINIMVHGVSGSAAKPIVGLAMRDAHQLIARMGNVRGGVAAEAYIRGLS